MMTQAAPSITIAEFERLAADKLPLVAQLGIRAEVIETGRVVMRLPSHDDHLRPGGTVSGPVMVALADVAVYALVLGLVGPAELVVTTNLTANFLRRPRAADLIAEARLLKLGKRLAVAEVVIHSDGEVEPVCHVTATYSMPPPEKCS
ncbi:MAG: PaaI family thioesterase [Pseudomonadota bacterium]|nr:PaaI family thioesterase [Pseudomonadota bacterium]